MTEEKVDMSSLLNDCSMSVVLLDTEDLVSLGEMLNKIEDLEADFASNSPAESDSIFTGLKKILGQLILKKIEDKNAASELLGQGISLLQDLEKCLSVGEKFKGDVKGFLLSIRKKLGLSLEIPKQVLQKSSKNNGQDEPTELNKASGDYEDDSSRDLTQDQELILDFIAESMENIEESEVKIVDLEEDPKNPEIINALFRSFHTIKGVSGFLNLTVINSFAHEVEELLDEARNERISITPPVIDLLLDSIDLFKQMITDIRTALEKNKPWKTDYPVQEFFERIKAVLQGEVQEVNEIKSDTEYTGWKLGEILIEQGMISKNELEKALKLQEEDWMRRLGEILIQKGKISEDDLEKALDQQFRKSNKKLGEILIESGKTSMADISEALDQQAKFRERKLGEVLISSGQAKTRDISKALREQQKISADKVEKIEHTVRVDTIKLDNLVDLVGELVITQSQIVGHKIISNLKEQKLIRDLTQMSRITSELQQTAMSMRMVPIRQTFHRMIRLVRDLSRKSGKKIELNMSGEDTEIDRNLVEEIYDPLVHMVRNAVDHGIESVEERLSKGKTPQGHIHIKAYHQGNNVVIEITDDGQGLNPEKIIAKAVDKGLISPESKLTDTSAFNLIFQPGFSTADKVTEVSGRGVGMDVVKKFIDKLQGKIDISSKPGLGSTFYIRLPLTLAIIEGITVRVGESIYILPTVAIREMFKPQRSAYHAIQNQAEIIEIRGEHLPLIRLYEIFGIVPEKTEPLESLVIVLENEGERRCIMVDEILGKQEAVIKNLGETLREIKGVAGGTILSNGRVGLILDAAGLFEAADNFRRVQIEAAERAWLNKQQIMQATVRPL